MRGEERAMSQTHVPTRPSGMKRAIALLVAVLAGGNGLAMLAAGPWWYGAVPGVTETGPFNPHFVKDIGAAYLTAGLGLAWLAVRPTEAAARGTAIAGARFPGCDPAGDPRRLGRLAAGPTTGGLPCLSRCCTSRSPTPSNGHSATM